MYKRSHRVSMGSLRGPALANIIMSECEKIGKLIKNEFVNFYARSCQKILC